MVPIPRRVLDRLCSTAKRFQTVLASAKSRDVNESDTAIIVTDMLAEVFGYDKYADLTSEFAIRGTACDLALRLDGKVKVLIEVKAIGLELKENHLKQAVDYAANQGVEWVILTNGQTWRLYKVIFGKPINQDLVAEFDMLLLDCKDEEQLELLFLLTKEAWPKNALEDYHNQRQALSRFSIAAMVLSEPVLSVLRREVRRISPDVRIDLDQVRAVLTQEVLKRELLEGEKADEARRKVNRATARMAKAKDHQLNSASNSDAISLGESASQAISTHIGTSMGAAALPP